MRGFVSLNLKPGVEPPPPPAGPPPPWMERRPGGISAFMDTFATYDLDRDALAAVRTPRVLRAGRAQQPRPVRGDRRSAGSRLPGLHARGVRAATPLRSAAPDRAGAVGGVADLALAPRRARLRGAAASTRRVATFLVPGQSVVGDRLPRRGVGDELADARPDPRITVERPHPDADRIGVSRDCGRTATSHSRRRTISRHPRRASRLEACPRPRRSETSRVRGGHSPTPPLHCDAGSACSGNSWRRPAARSPRT